MIIVGAGIAGLYAARRLGLRIVEAQAELPSNHHAVLRFRSSAFGDSLGIPFRRVEVIKASLPWRNPIADALAYAEKVTGETRSDRSIPMSVERVERYIAPPDLIARMAEGLDITYGSRHDFRDPDKVISTIPMPSLVAELGYDRNIKFEHSDGYTVTATIASCDAHATLYVPDLKYRFYRISITGDQLMIECSGAQIPWVTNNPTELVEQATILLGIGGEPDDVEVHDQKYQKILPIDEGERRNFIFWASSIKEKAFSLGRFATWRPRLLADDLVHDIQVIQKLASSSSIGYDAEKLERQRRA